MTPHIMIVDLEGGGRRNPPGYSRRLVHSRRLVGHVEAVEHLPQKRAPWQIFAVVLQSGSSSSAGMGQRCRRRDFAWLPIRAPTSPRHVPLACQRTLDDLGLVPWLESRRCVPTCGSMFLRFGCCCVLLVAGKFYLHVDEHTHLHRTTWTSTSSTSRSR